MKYTVRITESVVHEYEVDANSEDEASDMACERYEDGDVGFIDWYQSATEDICVTKRRD